MFVKWFVLELMVIPAALSVGVASAAFLEDYLSVPSEKALKMILEYCDSNPNGNITTNLVDTGNISEFFKDYTCSQATQSEAWFDTNSNPDSNTTNEG